MLPSSDQNTALVIEVFFGVNISLIKRGSENIVIIGDPLETDMSDWRLIGDRHASSEIDMPQQRPTSMIGDQLASSETQ